MEKKLVNGKYFALRTGNTITLYGATQVRCVNFEVRFEKTVDRVYPPIHAFYLLPADQCLDIPSVAKTDISFEVEDDGIESVIVRDASGDETVEVVNFSPDLILQPDIIWAFGENPTYIVIADALTGDTDCRVVPDTGAYFMTHKKVFGPASIQDCIEWQMQNCKTEI